MNKSTLFRALKNGVSCEMRALYSQTRVPALPAPWSRRCHGTGAASSLHAVMEGADVEEEATLSSIESIIGPLSSAPMVRQPRAVFEADSKLGMLCRHKSMAAFLGMTCPTHRDVEGFRRCFCMFGLLS